MSLPSPLKLVKEALFVAATLLVVLPAAQWVLIIAGALLIGFHHWVGILLCGLGIVGAYVRKNLRI